ncbi:hypothetical protein [Mycobacteroides chelonae]|uniref:hypothetical protein n=1 Tax=Mycobacteroides chelonae TaxID=1774 RepID=UPI0018B03F3E|nr:hypothetical protein [Mycobacteroides chelonae]MBF9519531.1 hypothetical protein [Mycobacteroides chelonae]
MTDTVTTITPAAVDEALLRLPGAAITAVGGYVDLTATVAAPVTTAPGLAVEAEAHDDHVRVRAYLPYRDDCSSSQFLEREIVPFEDHTSPEAVVAAAVVLAEALTLRVAGDALATNADVTRSHARAALAVIVARMPACPRRSRPTRSLPTAGSVRCPSTRRATGARCSGS